MNNILINKRGSAYLVALSGYIEEKNILIAKKRAKKIGFNELIFKEDILERYYSYAGNFLRRYNELNKAYHSSAKVIFNALGGMGAVHLLPYLDYEQIKKSGKVLVGYSDLTILLNYINQRTNARCLHGPHIGKMNEISQKTFDFLGCALDKKNYDISFSSKDIFKEGFVESKIVGGNLELLGRSLGTPYEIDTKNKIIFIEEYDMKSWRILDILWQLKHAGKFNEVKGLILGYFTKCGEEVLIYLKDFFKDFDFPIIFNQMIGHEEPNITIPISETCYINTKEKKWGIKFN